jgi:hypothetical protein
MERPPLSFAEVLDEELLFLERRREGRSASSDDTALPRNPKWLFRCEDFRELGVLQERINQKEPPLRYDLLGRTSGVDYCARFNELAGDPELLMRLLPDETFAENLLKHADIMRRILATSELRRMLLSDATIFDRLLSRDMLRITVAGGDEVADLLDKPDVHSAVRERHQLLGSIIASPDLRDELGKKTQRRRLAALAGVPQKQGLLRTTGTAIKNGFLKLIGRRPAIPPPPADAVFDFGQSSDVLAAMNVTPKENYVDAR